MRENGGGCAKNARSIYLRALRASVVHGVAAVTMIAASGQACAQRAAENAVTSAEDAFGTNIGNERTGLYSQSDVRGFSPLTAGNIRIEGLYFDQQGGNTARLYSGSIVRVGLPGLEYPFPAPTGIVDSTLRPSGDEPVVSFAGGPQNYGGKYAEVDVQLPIVPRSMSLAGGASIYFNGSPDGAKTKFVSLGAVPRIYLGSFELVPLGSRVDTRSDARPLVLPAGPSLPPLVRSGDYYGQNWAKNINVGTTYGMMARASLGGGFSLRAGIFGSGLVKKRNYTELFLSTLADGSAREVVISDPLQESRSTSGEARLTWTVPAGEFHHEIDLVARGRNKLVTYGGSSAQELGTARIGVATPRAQPGFVFGQLSSNRVRQLTGGLAYLGKWYGIGQINAGVQKTRYTSNVDQPAGRSQSSDSPILFNTTVAVFPLKWLALYGGYTRGLEESGVAPESASNRNEALPAARTEQVDGGVRLAFGAVKLVAGAFSVQKPYYSLDPGNRYTQLGTVRHRGFELSLAGPVTDRLNILAGAILMAPRVLGQARALGQVGEKPVGTTGRLIRIDLDYRLPLLTGASLTATLVHNGRRIASTQSSPSLGGVQLTVPTFTTLDIGGRYRFQVAEAPVTLRVLLSNVADKHSWNVVGSNTFQAGDTRRLGAYVTADF